jgi:hypothetical protein
MSDDPYTYEEIFYPENDPEDYEEEEEAAISLMSLGMSEKMFH